MFQSFGQQPSPLQVEQLERVERESRLALEAARRQEQGYEGEVPREHHELIHKLEEEWKQELEHLHRARRSAKK